MKGDFAGAAKWLSNDKKLSHVLVAVDATAEQDLGSKFSIAGYPTIKYFFRGKFVEVPIL
jgi:thiol-disulfide isomerase/thioredoxin